MVKLGLKGGDKLREYLKRADTSLDKHMTLKVGFLAQATYPNGTPVAMIAAIQEFGAPKAGIPPRPFFRNMIAKYSSEWPKGFATQLRETKYDVHLTFERVGQAIAGQLRQSIVDTNEPALKPATIKRKGFDKPLVDTGVMLNSIDHEIVEG